MAISRRRAIALTLAGGAGLLAAGAASKLDDAFDFEPSPLKNAAEGFADVFRDSDSSNAKILNREFITTLVSQYGPASEANVSINGNPHTFEVRTATIGKDPVLALYEGGVGVGTAKPWKSNVTPEQIYAAAGQTNPQKPANTTANGASKYTNG